MKSKFKDNVKAFNNDKKLKERFVKEALRHQKADRFMQGAWLQEKQGNERILKGCFYGCMTQTEDSTLSKAAEVMHLPLWVIHVSEKIFEGLKTEESLKFPAQLLKAIPEGMNSEKAYKEWHYRLLMDEKIGQINFTEKDSEQYKAVVQCAELFKMDVIDLDSASSAYSAVCSAADLADSAVYSACSAADSAADSAAYSAYSAVYSAYSAYSAVYSARSNHYSSLRDLLIEVVKIK